MKVEMKGVYKAFVRKSEEMKPPGRSKCIYVRVQVLTAASMKFRVFWDVAPAHFSLTTQHYIPEDSILHACVCFVSCGLFNNAFSVIQTTQH
jgi:hypothetical protein